MEIRLTKKEDASYLELYFSENREHFREWEPARDAGYYSLESISKRLAEYEQLHDSHMAAHFVGIIGGRIVAHCSLTNVVHGPLQGCFMGYGTSKNDEGSGVMTQVCQVALTYAFQDLGLNRVMANYMPSNIRSARLLKKLGFTEEGLAKKYLKINGTWEDHVLTSKINPVNS